MKDIWDSPMMSEIKNDDGTPFILPPTVKDNSQAPEGRYIFSLAVDGFNPFGSKTAKQTVTSTGIYMVCLNLPPDLRYLEENLYLVGVVPGPSKPSLQEMNHSLKLIVDDLLEFWNPGVFFSRTANYPTGRLVRCALGPVVCDLPAARQLLGIAGVSSTHFCSHCWITLDEMEELDPQKWPPLRTGEEHRVLAEQWKSANASERARLYKENGVRWSELLRLPYWDPIKFTVIDSMHNHYLGLLHAHCREVFGMDIDKDDNDGVRRSERKAVKEPPPDEMNAALRLLWMGDRKALLETCGVPLLWHLCLRFDLRRAKNKKKYLTNELMDWREDRIRQGLSFGPLIQIQPLPVAVSDTPKEASSKPPAGVVLGRKTLGAIQSDMERTITPSWVSPAPGNLGAASRGKLSADEWRTSCTINFPITLIRLWGGSDATERHRSMLRNFMDLVTAIEIGGMLVMSEELIAQYNLSLTRYLRSARTLYKEAVFKPNHHLALHIGLQILPFYGPLHSVRAFHTERMNYKLQQEKTNRKFGEMENTFMRQTCRAANLQALFQDNEVRRTASEMVNAYWNIFKRDSRGTRLREMFHVNSRISTRGKAGRLGDLTFAALIALLNSRTDGPLYRDIRLNQRTPGWLMIDNGAEIVSDVYVKGIKYTSEKTSPGDSYVAFTHPISGEEHVGSIQCIFSHTHKVSSGKSSTELFLAVQPLLPLAPSDQTLDPYPYFKHCGGKLGYAWRVEEFVAIQENHLVSHVAWTLFDAGEFGISQATIHTLPLDRMTHLMDAAPVDDATVPHDDDTSGEE
ncbi:hypothetical protein EUX98_g2602 [Antrodiella citrinella]|uniref:Uncharacterized protein n=1 Tax=Antrodiella citrinella TaxID=2447956 RepID=A0A4V3XJ40_9APHY|nr:hypothetical protein EUX98_g2602 [Antrodiella citrinella]